MFGNYAVAKWQEVMAEKYSTIDPKNLSPTQMITSACVLILAGLENQAFLDQTENDVAWKDIIQWADSASMADIAGVVTAFSESRTVGSLAKDIQANLPKDKTAKKKN